MAIKKKWDWPEYKPGQQTQDAYANYQQMAGQKPQDYASQYQGQMNQLFSQIQNRPKFKYDVNADALYQQYKDQYQRMGKMAMQDTMGQAQAMTGGYGNTYAQTVGNQAYQGYLQQLNDRVPQLEQRAYERYQGEGQDLYNQYGLAAQAEAMDYGKHQDAYNRWMQEQQLAYNQYADERGFDYGAYQDALQQQNWQEQFDYGQQRDAVADSQWQQGFDYGKERDQMADSQWQQGFDYGKERDQMADSQWQTQFDYGMKSDQQKQDFGLAMAAIQAGQTPSAELLARAGIDGETAKLLSSIYTPKASGGSTKKTKDIALNFTPDQITGAATQWKAGGDTDLTRYLEGLVLQGTSPEAAATLRDHIMRNYKVPEKPKTENPKTEKPKTNLNLNLGSGRGPVTGLFAMKN